MMQLKTTNIIPILFIVLVILLIFLPFSPGWISDRTAPIRAGANDVMRQLSRYWSWFGDVQMLSQQLEELATERNKLQAKLANLESVERENQVLRKQLSLGKKVDQSLILAKSAGIIDRGNEKYLLITAGSEDNIKVGQVVLSEQVLVGKIKAVEQHSSIVELAQTAHSVIPVVIRHEAGITRGIVKANFNLSARIDQVLPSERLQKGDVVLTSGEGGGYPMDIVVGTVGDVDKSDQAVFQSANITMPWNVEDLETVFVVNK